MSLTGQQIRMLADKGFTPEEMAAFDDMNVTPALRSKAAIRQARYRENKASGRVTNERNAVTSRKKEKVTQKEKTNTPSTPKGVSVVAKSDDVKSILCRVLPEETAAEVIAHRKAVRAPLTVGAAKGLVKNFLDYGDCLGAAEAMMAGGWKGFKADYMRKSQSRDGPVNGHSAALRTNARKRTDEQFGLNVDSEQAKPSERVAGNATIDHDKSPNANERWVGSTGGGYAQRRIAEGNARTIGDLIAGLEPGGRRLN